MTVTMSPFSKWDREDPNQASLLQNRVTAVQKGWTLNHWPHEFYKHPAFLNCKIEDSYKPPKMDETRLRLLRGPEMIEGI